MFLIPKYSTISSGISNKVFLTVYWKFFAFLLKDTNLKHFLCGLFPSSSFKVKNCCSIFSNFVKGPLPSPTITILIGKEELIIKSLINAFSSKISLLENNKRILNSFISYSSISSLITLLNFLTIKSISVFCFPKSIEFKNAS